MFYCTPGTPVPGMQKNKAYLSKHRMCPGHEPALECPKQYAGKLERGELGHKLYAACTKKKKEKLKRSAPNKI